METEDFSSCSIPGTLSWIEDESPKEKTPAVAHPVMGFTIEIMVSVGDYDTIRTTRSSPVPRTTPWTTLTRNGGRFMELGEAELRYRSHRFVLPDKVNHQR